MRTITKEDCQVLASVVKPAQLGPKGKEIYSRLFQEAYGVPFEMVRLLQHNRLSIVDLEKRLRMSRRTIFRYLLALEKTGCTVELDEKGYKITKLGKVFSPLAR